MNLARALRVHPAIIAGRICYKKNNYRLLSQFVGTGEVRPQFLVDLKVGRLLNEGAGPERIRTDRQENENLRLD